MFFHSLSKPDTEVYYQQMNCLLAGPLNISAFERAWQHVVDKHASLRIALWYEGVDTPLQVVQQRAPLTIEHHDWSSFTPDEQQRLMGLSLGASRAQKIDLMKAPLMRLSLIRLAEERFQLVWDWHHLLMDGWSLSLVLDEVFNSYAAFSQGREVAFAKSPSYREYIAWTQQQDFSAARTFWQAELKGFKRATGLEQDPPAAAIENTPRRDYAPIQRFAKQQTYLSGEAGSNLKQLARRHRLTLSTIVNAAWALVLNYHSGAADVTFGITVSGRPSELAGVEQMVGLFINTLPLRIQLSPEKSARVWLQEIQEKSTAVRRYEQTSLVDVTAWSDVPRGLPLFETIVVLENYPVDRNIQDRAPGLRIENAEVVDWNNYPLCVTIMPGEPLSLEIKYDCQRYAGSVIARVLGQVQTLLCHISGDETRVADLAKLISDSDHQQRARQEMEYTKNIRRKLSRAKRTATAVR
jgi:hypothetical protein